MTPKAMTVCRVLLALFTALVLVVTFYFAALGLGYAMDASATPPERMAGAACLMAYFALVVLLVGLLPLRGRPLLWLGVAGTLLLLPVVVGCMRLSIAAAAGSVAALLYLGAWWALARPRVSPRVIRAKLSVEA